MSTKVRKTSRDLQAEARREQLIDCAVQVFAAKGPDAGIKDIAAAAGVASGLVYHYFDSKQALLEAIIRERAFRSPLEEFLSASPEGAVVDVLHQVVAVYHDWLRQFGAMILVLDELARRDPQFAETRWHIVNQQFLKLAGYLEGRVAAGQLRPHDTDLASRALLYPIFLGWQQARAGAEFGGRLVDLLYEGIRPRQSLC